MIDVLNWGLAHPWAFTGWLLIIGNLPLCSVKIHHHTKDTPKT